LLVLPLITSPIVTRALGDTALGNYTYINSIAYYFLIFCNLGIAKYGQRLIASSRDDELALRKSFWSLFYVHLFFSLLSVGCYTFFIIFFVKENTIIYWLNVLYILSAMFDITWLFYGLENFKSVALKNLSIRVFCFILILIFVKTENDLGIYTGIQLGSLLLGNLVLLPFVFKNIKPISVSLKECKTHIGPMMILFISVLAVTLYSVFDKTLLGLMTNKENVAYYEYANKIIDIPKSFIVVIGTVLFPVACHAAKVSDYEKQRKEGKEPVFKAKNIDLPHETDYWRDEE
jgi:O-antigen/teichoic acid export membrane protein